MAEKVADKSSIAIETVLDWAYCEARVWWQTVGRSIEEKADNLISPRTGASLLKEAIQGVLKMGYQSHQLGNAFDFPTILGTLWKVRMGKWGIDHLREKMAAYSVLYADLMTRFGENGDIRKPNGDIFDNPTWSHRWRDLALSVGLSDLRKEIDAEQHKAGLGKPTKESATDIWTEPIGLADAFARSTWIIEKNEFLVEDFLGVDEEVYVTLPHIVVGVTPDLIRHANGKLIYEKHLYGIRPPRVPELMGDYSVKALFSARQESSDTEPDIIFVRHLMTGHMVQIKPRRAAGINEIEAMASAVQRRMNAKDYSGPRMVNGWNACGNCDYKPLCFDGEGIMQRYNLPLSGRITIANDLIEVMSSKLKGYTEEQKEVGKGFARVFLPFIAQNPGMTKDQIDWIISDI
jgi:hypothetical protein